MDACEEQTHSCTASTLRAAVILTSDYSQWLKVRLGRSAPRK